MLLLFCITLPTVFNMAVSLDTVIFQVERYSTARQPHFRDYASELWTAPVKINQKVIIPFCARSTTTIQLTNIMYSNDGMSDTIQVQLDGKLVGSFQTHSRTNVGKLWQEMNPSGPIGGEIQVSQGAHQLQLEVTQADTFGVELDAVFLEVSGSVKGDMLHCEAYCDSRINYKLSNKTKKVIGHTTQQVREPICPTDRNIIIPVYQNQLSSDYEITASRPKYESVSTEQLDAFPGCNGDDIIWKFNQVIAAPYTATTTIPGATLKFSGHPDTKAIILDVYFTPNDVQIPDGYQIIGGNLKIVMSNPQISAYFILEIFKNNKYVPQSIFRSMTGNSLEWSLPDFVMLKNSESVVRISIITDYSKELVLSEMVLEKIPKKNGTVTKLFSNEDVEILSETIDQWWVHPQSMSVSTVNNNKKGQNLIRVYKTIPFHKNKFEIMNLYSDGELKINALPPLGIDALPFGTSVVIGKFHPQSERPLAQISSVDINPATLSFSLLYKDGSTATLRLKVIREDTVVSVTNVTFPPQAQGYPIAAVRSSWIHDGQNHIDHVAVDDREPTAVMASRWQSFYGEYFSFFRRCVTSTDTQSSDISIQLFNRAQ